MNTDDYSCILQHIIITFDMYVYIYKHTYT